MRFESILFDLDGTLTESGPGITRSVQYALHRMGIEEQDLGKLEPFVGPPLNLSFRERYGMNEEESAQAIHYFRERYDTSGVYENRLYPGVRELLSRLHKAGVRLAIASSKPEPMVHKVLEHFGIEGDFNVIVGSRMEEELDNKMGADNKLRMVQKALQGLGIPEGARFESDIEMSLSNSSIGADAPAAAFGKTAFADFASARYKYGTLVAEKEAAVRADEMKRRCAMVGDRSFDMRGAKANRVTAVGVTYGYGSRRELEEAGADFIAANAEELGEILLQ